MLGKSEIETTAAQVFHHLPATPQLATVYVPSDCGSGICGTILARDALGLKTKVVGVVADTAQAAKLSVAAGKLVETGPTAIFADAARRVWLLWWGCVRAASRHRYVGRV